MYDKTFGHYERDSKFSTMPTKQPMMKEQKELKNVETVSLKSSFKDIESEVNILLDGRNKALTLQVDAMQQMKMLMNDVRRHKEALVEKVAIGVT
jgi:hypothetical protein